MPATTSISTRFFCVLLALCCCAGDARAAAESSASEEATQRETLSEAQRVLAQPDSAKSAADEASQALIDLARDASSYTIKGESLLLLGHDALIRRQDLKSAIERYRRSLEFLAPQSSEWLAANLGLGTAVQHHLPVSPDSIREATLRYETVIDRGGPSLLAAQARLNLGRIHELKDFASDTADLEAARQQYKAIMQQWPSEEIAHEAALRHGSAYIQEAYFPSEERRSDWPWRIETILTGIDHLREWTEKHPNHGLASAFWEYIGNTYLLLPKEPKWRELALSAYLNAAGDKDLRQTGEPAPEKRNIDRVNPGYLYLRIASLAHQQDQREIALEYYSRLISEAPAYGHASVAALQLMENMGFSKQTVLERVESQYRMIGYSDVEIDRLLQDLPLLEPPSNVPVPVP